MAKCQCIFSLMIQFLCYLMKWTGTVLFNISWEPIVNYNWVRKSSPQAVWNSVNTEILKIFIIKFYELYLLPIPSNDKIYLYSTLILSFIFRAEDLTQSLCLLIKCSTTEQSLLYSIILFITFTTFNFNSVDVYLHPSYQTCNCPNFLLCEHSHEPNVKDIWHQYTLPVS